MRILITGFAALVLCTQMTAQSGWTQPKGNGFYKLSQDILRASDFFNPDGDVIEITT